MIRYFYSALFVFCCCFTISKAQTSDKPADMQATKVDSLSKKQKRDADKVRGKMKLRLAEKSSDFRPRIAIGAGIIRYIGDVRDHKVPSVHTLGNRYALDFTLSGNISRNFDLSITYMMGKLSGNENNTNPYRNFESKMTLAGMGLSYNFRSVFGRQTLFNPYLYAGVFYSQYSVFTDRSNADGYYHYWQDGYIRNQDESLFGGEDVKYLDRDYIYETKLTPSKPIRTVSVPIGIGVNFNVTKRIALKIGTQYFFAIGDISRSDSLNAYAIRHGYAKSGDVKRSRMDGYFYTYLNLSFNFFPFKEKPNPADMRPIDYVDFSFMSKEDTDEDGVIDLYDKCLGTPKMVAVNGWGCPLDDDEDGIPNYLDKETSTQNGRVTDVGGKAINFSELNVTKKDTSALARKEVTKESIFPTGDKNPNYTVHVGTYGKNMPTRLQSKLNAIPGLVETKINDTLTVYTLGNYKDFVDAEKKQNQLIQAGYDQAFGINDKKVKDVSTVLDKLSNDPSEFTNDRREKIDQEKKEEKEKTNELLFKVELTEYRMRIGMDKLSNLIAKYGVEVHSTTGGLKRYTIGAFKTPEEAEVLRNEIMKMGIQQPAITPYLDGTVIDMEDAIDIMKNPKKVLKKF